MARPPIRYLLLDLPADHEVESSLATQCGVIESVIHNEGRQARVKRLTKASEESFRKRSTYKYDITYVHLACHANANGIGLLGGRIGWQEVAETISGYVAPLRRRQRRVIAFSCCHSAQGFEATRDVLKDCFTDAVHWTAQTARFGYSITAWSMFYLMQGPMKPDSRVLDSINTYFDEEMLAWKKY